MSHFLIMLTPPYVEFGFFLIEFQTLNILHYYDMNIVVWVISLVLLKDNHYLQLNIMRKIFFFKKVNLYKTFVYLKTVVLFVI